MGKKPYIKYLSSDTGEYESPTLPDIGQIDELQTAVKTSLVDAINSMIADGVPSSEVNEKIAGIKDSLDRLRNGEWTEEQLQSLAPHVQNLVEIPLTDFQQGLDTQKDLWNQSVQGILDQATNDYNTRVAQSERILGDAQLELQESVVTLDEARTSLNNMELHVVGYEEKFDDITKKLTTVVYNTEFDLMTAEFIKNKTIEIETSEGVKRESVLQILSAMDGRVAKSESDYELTAEALKNTVTHQELQGTLDQYQFDKYGDNVLRGTRDFRDWNLNGAITSAGASYRQAKTVTLFNSTQEISNTVTDLEIGRTYTITVSMHYEGTEQPTPYMLTNGTDYPIDQIYEDTRQFDGWIKLYGHFIADRKEQQVSFYVNGIPLGQEVLLSNFKIEFGEKPTPWKPHIDDTFAELEIYDSRLIQQANAITSWLRKIAQDDEGTLSQDALWQVTAEGLLGQAKTIKEVQDGKIQQDTAELILESDRFATEVEKTVNYGIEGINVDNRNRVLNSNYLFNFEQWSSVSSEYKLQEIDGIEFAMVSRKGLLANNPASMRTNVFRVSDKDNLMIGLDVYTSDKSTIDNDTFIRLELFDISDIRIGYKDIKLSEMQGLLINNRPSRFIAKYKVENSMAVKGQVILQVPRNGDLGFSQLSVQSSDININEWQPAPEDLKMVQLRMNSWIEQDAESVAIGAIKKEIQLGKLHDTGAFSEMWSQIKTTAEDITLAVAKDGIIQAINLSAEELLIDFERVNITGELLANIITTQYLDVSKGFRIMNGDFPVLQANSNGEVEMNIKKLTINAQSALTEADKPGMEQSISDNLEDKIKPYVHYAYADSADGSVGFIVKTETTEDSKIENKRYMGTYSDHVKTNSYLPSKYTWVRIKGEEPFIAYATSETGDNFNTEPFEGAIFLGLYMGFEQSLDRSDYKWTRVKSEGTHVAYATSEFGDNFSKKSFEGAEYIGFSISDYPSDRPFDYEWSRMKGEDAYRVEIRSTNGSVFKNGVIDTWFYAVVYKGSEDITAQIDVNRFRWTRISDDAASDKIWNEKYFGGTKEIRITTEDVYRRATFECSILDEN